MTRSNFTCGASTSTTLVAATFFGVEHSDASRSSSKTSVDDTNASSSSL